MTFIDWIDRNLSEIRGSLIFGKYFDSIGLEDLYEGFALFNPQLGIDLIIREDYSVKTIHFYSGRSKSAAQFRGDLPFNISFSLSQEETRTIFGNPQALGGGEPSIFSGIVPYWDRYSFELLTLHFQFTESLDGIELITISSKKEKF